MPVRFLRLLFPILCCCAAAWAHAQPVCDLVLSGRVIDNHDRQPLSYAEVYVPALGKGAVADQEGRFVLAELCPGPLIVRVSHLGCAPVMRTIQLLDDVVMEIKLEHHAEELKEFEVLQQRPDEHVGQANKELDKASMEKDAGRSMGEMLARIPGVSSLQSGPTISKTVIHGLSGNRILTLNQGIRQEDQQWGTEHAPNLDPLSSDRITVVKGAASVQYGSDALGGVIITEPVELPRERGVSGEVRGMGMLNSRGVGGNALLQGGVGGIPGLGWRVQGSGRYLGDSEAPGYVLSNTGVREGGASASVGYRDHRWNASAYYSYFTRDLGILRASHIGNLTDLNNAIESGTPWYVGDFTYAIASPRQQVQHHLIKADGGYAISERDRIVLTYGYQADDRQEYDIRRGGRSDIPALDLFLTTHTADAVLNHWAGKHIHGKVGVSGVYQENVNVPGTGVRPLLPNYRKQSGGVFLLEHLPLSPNVELEAGARIEATQLDVAKYTFDNVLITPQHRFTNSAFTIGANWSVKDSVRLRFNVGSAYRPPHVSELYSEGLHHGAAAIERGDAALSSERSLKGTADLEALWFGGRLRTDLTLYADRIDHYIYLRPDGVELTVRGAFPVFQYVATDVFLYGVDATVQLKLAQHFSLRNRTSLVRGRDLAQDEWLFQMPSDRMENALLFELSQVGKWSAIECAATSQVVFAQSRIPVGLDFTLPPDSYNLIGLSASATRTLGKNEMRIGLQANNLFNTTYRDYMDRFRYYADARGTDLTLWIRYSFGKR
ncbi:MAG: TonB-dependent receptor [Flavobacteriales bacterium]|nr:TonB-dependent receptor [Flavobacteriales bacterium]